MGIVGCGSIAKFHASKLKALGVEQLAYYDKDNVKSEVFSEIYGGKKYNNIDSLLQDVDAVYICSPPSSHFEAVKSACDYKRPIFLEKPVAHNLEAGIKISEVVKELPGLYGVLIVSLIIITVFHFISLWLPNLAFDK